MPLRRTILTLTTAAIVSLGLPVAAASAAPAAGAPAAAVAAADDAAQAASPNITWRTCAGQTTTWVLILEYRLRVGGLNAWCFGYTGTWHFPTTGTLDYTYHFCAGNNRGSITVTYWPAGTRRTFSFGPGTQLAWATSSPPVSLVSLTITGWSGSNTCRG